MTLPRSAKETTTQDYRQLILILLLALVHGLLYVFIVPPWQHYDEPNHFEYAWLVADRNRLPVLGDYDQPMSYAVVESMLASGFFDGMAEKPVLESPDQPIPIPGYSQFDEPPLYYLLVSLPLRFISDAPVTLQLTVARLVSLILYLVTILAAWGIMLELTLAGHPLRWMMPLTLALLPGFTDLMTAVNSDSAAVVLVSLFLWGSVRLIHRFSILDLFWTAAVAVLAFFTKNIAFFSLILLPFVLLFSVFRGKWRWVVWSIVLGGSFVLVLAALVWGDAAHWPRLSSQRSLTRTNSAQVVHGEFALALEVGASAGPERSPLVFQSLPMDVVENLRGKDLTFGYWIWADQNIENYGPHIRIQSEEYTEQLPIGTTPQFFASHVHVPLDAQRLWIYYFPINGTPPGLRVYNDGLVLAVGQRPLNTTPTFSDPSGITGEWGGQPFENQLRNPSFETGFLRVRSELDEIGVRVLPNLARPSMLLDYLTDWESMSFFHLLTLDRLERTFWAHFGWGHVPVQPSSLYAMFSFVGILALVGVLAGFIRFWRSIPWDIVFIFGSALVLAWSTTFTRSFGFAFQYKFYVPVARHTFPAIIPAVLFLTFGWYELFEWFVRVWGWLRSKFGLLPVRLLERLWAGSSYVPMLAYGILWLVLDFLSLFSIVSFYR